MASLRLQQDIQSRRKLEVECEGSLEPFWRAGAVWGVSRVGAAGVWRLPRQQLAGSCRGLACPCPELCRAQLALQTLSFQPCCSLCSSHWGLWLHRAGLCHLGCGCLAAAKGDFGRLDLARFWWERTVPTRLGLQQHSPAGEWGGGRHMQDLLSSLKPDFNLPALEK